MNKNILAFLIGLIILAYTLSALGVQSIISLLSEIRPEFFVLAGILYLITDIIAAMVLKTALGGKLRVRNILPAHMLGMLYANATPGRVGYYYTALSLAKKTGSRRSGNVGIITLFQGMNFFTKIFLCLLAVVYFSQFIPSIRSQLYLLLVSITPAIFLLMIGIALYTKLLNGILARLSQRVLEYLQLMQTAVRDIDRKRLLRMLMLMLLGWVTMSFQWFLLAMALGIDITLLTVLMIQPLLTTVMFIPISPAGLGLAEGGSAILFKIISLNPAAGAAFILLVRLNSILVDSLGLVDVRRS